MCPSQVHELIYISASTSAFSPASLAVLLAKARAKNTRLGITGMLLHVDGSFFQVLEGAEDAVFALYATIEKDTRHRGVLRLFRTERAIRSFAEWTMGFVDGHQVGLRTLGFNDFFRRGLADAKLDPRAITQARELAMQFARGRWRQHVSHA